MEQTEEEKSRQMELRDEKIAEHNSDNIIESYDTKDGGRVDILKDRDSENPLDWDAMSLIVGNSRSDRFSYSVKSDDPYSYAMNHGAIVALPVLECPSEYKLDRDPNSTRTPDAVIYLTPERIMTGNGEEGVTLDHIIKLLKGDLETYSAWAHGDVYMANVYDKNGKLVEEPNGFYKIEDIKEEWQ